MPRVLCTSLGSESGPHLQLLRQAGFDPVVVDRSLDLWDAATLVRELQGAVACVAGSEPFTREVLAALPELRSISRTGVGYDAIDVAACDELGVIVTTTPGVNHDAVAEQTIAMLMALARDFPRQDMAVRRGAWVRTALPRVQGSRLGLIGLGRIGKAVAWRAVGLGMKVLAYEPQPDGAFCDRYRIEVMPLDDLLTRSDYVSLHCPATAESRHLMNAGRLTKMKRGSVLINTARGPLIDEPALIQALKSGHLRGAGLDVFETEPLPADSPLTRMENVLLAGHVAGLDAESHRDSFAMAADNIILLARNTLPPADRVQNRAKLAGWTWERRGVR